MAELRHSLDLDLRRTKLAEERTSMADTRSHLANERTHLSYVRTALALVGLGITLNRLGFYLAEAPGGADSLGLRDARIAGFSLVVLGVLLLAWALRRFAKVTKQIEQRDFQPRFMETVLLTLALAAGSFGVVIWLFVTRP